MIETHQLVAKLLYGSGLSVISPLEDLCMEKLTEIDALTKMFVKYAG